jgi:hypothetical protein
MQVAVMLLLMFATLIAGFKNEGEEQKADAA